MAKNRTDVQIQVNNIMETLRNFSKSDADSEAIAEGVFDELQNANDDGELQAAFDEFVDLINNVAAR